MSAGRKLFPMGLRSFCGLYNTSIIHVLFIKVWRLLWRAKTWIIHHHK